MAEMGIATTEQNLWLYKAAEKGTEFHGGPDTEDVMKLTIGKSHGKSQYPRGLFEFLKDSLFGSLKTVSPDEIHRSAPHASDGKEYFPIRLVFVTPEGSIERWELKFYKDAFGQWSVIENQ